MIRSKRQLIIVTGIFTIVILLIIAIPYYQNYIAPYKRAVITVDNTIINMRYFIDRTRRAGADPMSMLHTLTNEEIVKLEAPRSGIRITDDDVKNELNIMAGGSGKDLSVAEFREWYRQRLNDSKMTDTEYREMIRIKLLYSRMNAYLATKVPAKAPQVHLHIIVMETYEEAQKVSERLNSGENFAKVARQVSLDTKSRDVGGDMGWLPPSLTNFSDQIAMLEINRPSDPTPYFNRTGMSASNTNKPEAYYILKISGKEKARPVSGEYMKILKNNALENWLQKEIGKHQVKYNFSSDIYSWVNKELRK